MASSIFDIQRIVIAYSFSLFLSLPKISRVPCIRCTGRSQASLGRSIYLAYLDLNGAEHIRVVCWCSFLLSFLFFLLFLLFFILFHSSKLIVPAKTLSILPISQEVARLVECTYAYIQTMYPSIGTSSSRFRLSYLLFSRASQSVL